MSSNCSHPTCFDSEVCRRKTKPKKAPTPLKRNKVPIKRAAIKRYNAKPKHKSDELEQFFADCMDIVAKHPYCSNCSAWIAPMYYRHAVAHILFKKIFKSIASHPLCWIKLGVTCGCHECTHRLDTFSRMAIFPEAVRKFREIEHLITERHKLLETFRNYANELCPIRN